MWRAYNNTATLFVTPEYFYLESMFFRMMINPKPLYSGLNHAGMTDKWHKALKSPL